VELACRQLLTVAELASARGDLRELKLRRNRQRACLVLVPNQRSLRDERFDVLEHRNLADAELVGDLLHRWRVPLRSTRVVNHAQDAELLRSEIHRDFLQAAYGVLQTVIGSLHERRRRRQR
jgi:hypothetical protein